MNRHILFLKRALCLLISTSIFIQHVAAAEVILNHVHTQAVQNIQPQTNHAGQYALRLTPDLWNIQHNQRVVLREGEVPLGVFHRPSEQSPLVFQCLENPNKAHFHFYPDEAGVVSHGQLVIQSPGRVSVQPGNYKGITQINAKRIYLNRSSDHPSSSIKLEGSFFLESFKEIRNRASLDILGHLKVSTPHLSNKGAIQGKGKGIFHFKTAQNQSSLRFSKDVCLTGYEPNTPFDSFQNHILTSKTNVTMEGNHYKQSAKGRTFAGLILQTNLQSLHGRGDFIASFLYLHAAQSILFQSNLLQTNALSLKTLNYQGKDSPTIRVRTSLQMDVKNLVGSGKFEVGATSAWALPYHLFYEKASPKGGRAAELHNSIQRYFSHHKEKISSLFGCHINAQSIDLDSRTSFDIIGGPTHLKTIYGLIQGRIQHGPYNDHAMSINARDLDFSGMMKSHETHLTAHRALLSGELSVKNFLLDSHELTVSGLIQGTSLQSTGQSFKLAPSGHIQTAQVSLDHQTISIDGTLQTGQLYADSYNFRVTNQGTLQSSHAHINSSSIAIDGSFSSSSLDLQGSSMQVSGELRAGSVNNYVSSWNVNGKADISSFSSYTSSLTLNGGEGFKIRSATIHTLEAYLGGKLTIQDLNLWGKSLEVGGHANLTGGNWNLHLSDKFRQNGNIALSSLFLETPQWVQAPGSTLTANVVEGLVQEANLAGSLQTDQVTLKGNHFHNEGKIRGERGIDLSYDTYHLGSLSTKGTLSLDLNDRTINEDLLRDFEQQFAYGQLSLKTNAHLLFTQSLSLNRGLALSAPSISFGTNAPQYPFSPHTWSIYGDLMLHAREGSISLSQFNIFSQRGTYLSQGDLQLVESILQTQKKMLFDIQGSVILNRGAHAPSLLRAGQEGMYGSVNGKFINNASEMVSAGEMTISARQGVEFKAEERHHRDTHTKRTHGGSRKKTTVHEWNEILSPTATAAGAIHLLSSEGGASLDSAKITSAEGVAIITKEEITNQQRVTYNNTLTKKRHPFSKKRVVTKTQKDSPTVLASWNAVKISSSQDKLHLPNTLLIGSEVVLDACKDVYLSVPTLREEYSYKKKGVTFSHALSGKEGNYMRSLMGLDPLLSSLMSLYDMRSQGASNKISGGIRAGIQGYNTYRGYQNTRSNGENLSAFFTQRLLSSLFSVQIGYQDSRRSAFQTVPGQGGIFAAKATIQSRQGNIYTLNGVPLDVEKLTISCPQGKWTRQDFKSTYGSSSRNTTLSIGLNLLTMTPSNASLSDSSSNSEGVRWIRQQITDPNPIIEAQSIVHLTGVDSSHQSQKGYGFSFGENSFSCQINGYGFSFAAPSKDGLLGAIGIQAKGMDFTMPIRMKNEPQPHPASLSPIRAQSHQERSVSALKSGLNEKPSPQPSQKNLPLVNGKTPAQKPAPITQENYSYPLFYVGLEDLHEIQSFIEELNGHIWEYKSNEGLQQFLTQSNDLRSVNEGSTTFWKSVRENLSAVGRGIIKEGEDLVWGAINFAAETSYFIFDVFVIAGSGLPSIYKTSNGWEVPDSPSEFPLFAEAEKNMVENANGLKQGLMAGGSLARDGFILMAGSLTHAHSLEILRLNGIEVPFYKETALYRETANRWQEQFIDPFKGLPLTQQIELGSALVTSFVLPGAFLKAARYSQLSRLRYGPLYAGGNIGTFTTTETIVCWRVFDKNEKGFFLTPVLPTSRKFAQYALALHPTQNTAKYIQKVSVGAGVTLERSRAYPQTHFGKNFRGGGIQYKILSKEDLNKIHFGPKKLLK